MHHPDSFGGYRWLYSGEISLEIYPEWDIADDKSFEASQYWKWLVGHYASQIAKTFNMKEADICHSRKWNEVRKKLDKQCRQETSSCC